MKRCPSCGKTKPKADFYKHSKKKDGLQSICKVCHRGMVDQYQQADYKKIKDKARGYYHNNIERNRTMARERYRQDPSRQRIEREKIKTEVLTHYGGGVLACIKCGFSDIRALSIDHISGNGTGEKKRLHRLGSEFYRWLKKNQYPGGYQTLCMNCQFIKREENKEYNQWTQKKQS